MYLAGYCYAFNGYNSACLVMILLVAVNKLNAIEISGTKE